MRHILLTPFIFFQQGIQDIREHNLFFQELQAKQIARIRDQNA